MRSEDGAGFRADLPPLPLPPLPDPHRAVRACGATPGYKLTDRHGSTPRDPGVESTVTTLPGVNLAGPGAYGSHAGCSCGNTPTALFCLGAGLHPTGRAGGLPEGDVIIKDVRVRNVKTGFARREPGISSPGNHRKDTWWQRPHHSSASDVCTTTGLPEAPLHPAIAGGCRYRLPEPGVFCFDRPDPGAPEAAGTFKKKGGGGGGGASLQSIPPSDFLPVPTDAIGHAVLPNRFRLPNRTTGDPVWFRGCSDGVLHRYM